VIKIKVKSTWQGKVGIRDKYVNQAIREKQGLDISCQGEFMIIPAEKVKEKMIGKSQKHFKDKFSEEWHYLIYFNWKPNNRQGKLL